MRHIDANLHKIPRLSYQLIRTYVSTVHANTLKVPARIKKEKSTIYLQMLMSRQLGPQLNLDMTLREYMFGSTWHPVLKISRDHFGVISGSSAIENLKPKIDNSIFIAPEAVIFPEKLFGIPQDIWDAFLAYLEHQDVVNLLNLKQHRHLWPAYQYAVSASEPNLRIARAKLIGQFHFLLSIVLYTPNEIAAAQFERQEGFNFEFLNDVKQRLDQGKFYKQEMREFHACLTPFLIKKLRHCSNIMDLGFFATLISDYAKLDLDLSGHCRKLGAINMLPSSVEAPHRFASYLSLAKKMHHITLQPGLLFFNSQTQWDSQDAIDEMSKNYFDALFHDLVRRQLMLQAHAANVLVDHRLISLVKRKFEALFIGQAAINSIKIPQRYWQHNAHMIAEAKPVQNQIKFWSPIIDNLEIDGVKIRALASESALIQHGEIMQHCVQGEPFIALCRSLQGDVLELVSEDMEMSTLDLRRGKDYYILQHVSVGGIQKPSQRHLDVGVQVLEGILSGKIPLSKARHIEKPHQSYEFDYALDDLLTQEHIYQIYKSKKMLPSRMMYANYLEMLEMTQLKEIINDALGMVSQPDLIDSCSNVNSPGVSNKP